MSSFRVGIIGGGIVGTSVLYHLVDRHGVADAVLFEAGRLGGRTTGKSTGGVRNVFTDPEHRRMGEYGLDFYDRFDDRVGGAADFQRDGYLYILRSDAVADEWRDRVETFRSNGIAVEVLTPDETVDRYPTLDPGQFVGAVFAADCGFVDPAGVARGFANAATASGASIETETPVTGINTDGGRVTAIRAGDDRTEVDAVVDAAGPWAGRIARLVDVELPIELMCRRIAVTSPIATPGDPRPLVLDVERELSFRATRDGAVHAVDKSDEIWGVEEPDRYDRDEIDAPYGRKTLEKLSGLMPTAANARIVDGWAGVRTITPDSHPILGPTGCEGLYVACGFAGHGVMFAPSVGAAMADLIVEGETDVIDLAQFSLDRFGRDDSIREEMEH